MPEIRAFRGLRYDLGHVGALSDVIAPPYDVIDDELQDELYKKHPANVIRLILNRDEPGDSEDNNRYTRAAKFLRNWRTEGVLQMESDPAIYVYHQVFSYGGEEFTRRGFMARTVLQPFGEGNIYPHEETHSAAKADRLNLTRATRANLSQIFGIYPDAENEAQNLLEASIMGETPLEATDHLGVLHRLWPVTDIKVISEVAAVMHQKPTYVADGHHRYETACNYKKELADRGELTPESPANCVLMMCVSMYDPGMIVLPTHRLFRGLPPITSEELIAKLTPYFDTEIAGEGIGQAEAVWSKIENRDEQGMMGFYAAKDGRWVLATINDKGRTKMDEVASDHTSDWRELGVSLLHRLVIENLLGAKDLPKCHYVHLVEEAVEGLENDSAGEFSLACLVMPATVDHIRTISEHAERMPAKSTYFYPKLLSGLVINPID
ncbi:DUF1015 domain-containing protein [Lignipirellula cremea]|uniref:Phosphatase n=1 Tax=Lignipirellula cremea TaxID=2528010 RepID=A0A518DTP1_9BACT|nr:DUF1015 domain-containing protein [Lignipirellula cremea]QDU95211.1 hypothetical protein Pla8534_30260 [Lignipirellula cremea]